RLDGGHEWFRYHQLFRTMLRHHLREEEPQRERALLALASEWHIDRGQIEAGIGYLIDACDWEGVLAAASTHSRTMFRQGTVSSIACWIEQVPADVRLGRIDVVLLHAAALVFGDDARPAGDVLAAIEEHPQVSPQERAVATLLHAFLEMRLGNPAHAVIE